MIFNQRLMFNVIIAAISATNSYHVPGRVLNTKDKTLKNKVFSVLVKFAI